MRALAIIALCAAAQLGSFPNIVLSAERDPRAVALLRGAELARVKHDSLAATIELRWSFPSGLKTARCEIEMAGQKRRSEVYPGEGNFDAAVVIRDGDEFRGYRRNSRHGDLDIYDLERAQQARGDVAFDPRTLGLSDLMSAGTTLKHCFRYDEYAPLTVDGKETLRGVETWRVKARHEETDFEFWIEEPSFRVHRKTVQWGGPSATRIEIDSYFDSPEIPAPFPSRVVAVRTSGDSREERRYDLKRLELGAKIPPERFTLNSIGLPVNTMINDYRISRIVGYWDGQQIAPSPVSQAAERRQASDLSAWHGWALVVGTCGLLVALALIGWQRRRKK